MDEWMDEPINEWMNEQINRWMDEPINRWMEWMFMRRLICGLMDG